MTLFLAPEKVKSGYFNFHHPAVIIFRDSIEMCIILFGKGKGWRRKDFHTFFFGISYSSFPTICQVCSVMSHNCLVWFWQDDNCKDWTFNWKKEGIKSIWLYKLLKAEFWTKFILLSGKVKLWKKKYNFCQLDSVFQVQIQKT